MGKRKRSALGSINEVEPGKFVVRVTVGSDPVTGQQVRLSRTVYGTARDAESMKARLLMQSGRSLSTMRTATVYQFLTQQWLPEKESEGLRESSIRGYRLAVENHIRDSFGKVRMGDLTTYQIQRKLNSMPDKGAALNVWKVMSPAMKSAMNAEIIEKNPMAGVKRPSVPRYVADTYNLEEFLDVLYHFQGDEIESGVLIAATCGLRRSETCGLDCSDISLRCEESTDKKGRLVKRYEGEVSVTKAYHQLNGMKYFADPKSEKSDRLISLPAFAVEWLMDMGVHRRIGPLLVNSSGRLKGQRTTPDGFTYRWDRVMAPKARKGRPLVQPPVRKIELKNLRHSQSTILVDLGAQLIDVSRRDGHADIRTTTKFYVVEKRANVERRTSDIMDRGVRGAMAKRLKKARENIS